MLVSSVSELHLNTHKPPLHLLLGQSTITNYFRKVKKNKVNDQLD